LAACEHYGAAIGKDCDNVEWLAHLAECRLLLADVEGARAALAASIKADAPRRKARGRSVNFSQNHLAQVMEEFLFDQPALEEMRAIVKLSAEAQVEPLRALARRNPDNTAPALLLLNAMRRAGYFDIAANLNGGSTAIAESPPRRIVQYWNEREPPEDVARLMATWRDANPEFQHIVLHDGSAEERLRAYNSAGALRAFRSAREIPQKADILRWAVLAFEGGFFVDADDRCLRPLATFVPSNISLVGYQERIGSIGSNFIGAAKGHPAIVSALAQAVTAIDRGDRDMVWLATGAGLLTRTLAQEFATADEQLSERGIVILRAETLNGAVGAHVLLSSNVRTPRSSLATRLEVLAPDR
jgi:hypothetical protein